MTSRKMYNGRCTVCDTVFLGMHRVEYNEAVTNHIMENHRDQPLDKELVVPI